MIRHSNFEGLEDMRYDVVQKSDETVVITHLEHDALELIGEWKAVLNNDGSQRQTSHHRSVPSELTGGRDEPF